MKTLRFTFGILCLAVGLLFCARMFAENVQDIQTLDGAQRNRLEAVMSSLVFSGTTWPSGGGGSGISQDVFANYSTNFTAAATYTLGNLAGSTQLVSVTRLDIYNSTTAGTNFTVAINGIPLATNYTIGGRSFASFEKFGFYPNNGDTLKVIGDSGLNVLMNYTLVSTNQWGSKSLDWGTSTNNLLPTAVPSGQYYRVNIKVFNPTTSSKMFTLFLDKGSATNLITKDYMLGARSMLEFKDICLNSSEALMGYGTNCVSHVLFERR